MVKRKNISTAKKASSKMRSGDISMMQATVLLDASFTILSLNNNASKLLKRITGRKVASGENFIPLVSKEFAAPVMQDIKQALKRRSNERELQLKTWKGESATLLMSSYPVLDLHKKALGISLLFQDITEFKQTKSALQDSRDLINSVFHTADIGIAVIDEKGRYVKTNIGYNKLFGYKTGALDGKLYTLTVPENELKQANRMLLQFFAGAHAPAEHIGRKKNGDLFIVFRTVNLLHNANGHKYLVITARDISETRKYQHLLLETEKMAGLAGWEIDIVSEQITGTAEFYHLLAISEKQFSQLTFQEQLNLFLEKENRNLVLKVLREAIQTGKPFDIQFKILLGTGHRKWLRVSCSPDPKNKTATKLTGLLQDITAIKESEMELERLSLVASKTNNAVIITDEKGEIVWVNESFEKLTGFNSAEVLHQKPGKILQGPGTDPAVIKMISGRLKKNLKVSAVIKNYRKNGSAFWINMDIAPVFDGGRVVNFIGVGIDVTELINAKEIKRMNQTLEQQQQLFNAIARNFPDGIIGVLDAKFHYMFVGGAEIRRLGLTESDFIGNDIFDHISLEGNANAYGFLEKAKAGENVNFEATLRENIYAVTAVPLLTESNEVVQILVVLVNITNRKKAERDLTEALKKEKELGDLKTRFVSMASHEFRTPLSTILSSSYLIERYTSTADQEKRMKHLHRIIAAVEILTEILNDFLSLGKIEEGKILVKISEFNMEEQITATIREMENNLRQGQTVQYRHTGKLHVMLDPGLLKHIVMNLLSNASKFSPEGSDIIITSFVGLNEITFSVRDRGIGISVEDQQHLMERFFRGANAGNIQGTGLGLHLVAKYAELMGGKVACNSELEKGSEFIISLPVKSHNDSPFSST